MISRSEYEALRLGDLIEIVSEPHYNCKNTIIYTVDDAPNRLGEFFPCSGFLKKANSVIAFLPLNKYEVWDNVNQELRYYEIDYQANASTGGWWIDRVSIRSWKRGNRTIETSHKKETPPLPCQECKQFYPYAIANFGNKLICWSCRDSLGWKYGKDSNGAIYLKS